MTDPLNDAIRSVFSVLPENMVRDARNETLRHLFTNKERFSDELKWIEIGDGNKVVRAGATDLSGFTRIFMRADDDCDTAALAAQAEDGVYAGQIIASSDQHVLFWFVAPALELTKGSVKSMKGLAISLGLFVAL